MVMKIEILRTARREWFRMIYVPLYLPSIIFPPLLCYVLFTTLMSAGLPTKLPCGIVNMDESAFSRNVIRNLGAFQHTDIIAHYPNAAQAESAMRQGKIYAFYYIPDGLEAQALSGRQPIVSFYLNYAYLIAGSLLYEDMRTLSELTGAAIQQASLYAHGSMPWQTTPILQPILLETHPLHNPWLNYSVYLNNTLLPGILSLMVLLVTVYSIGTELKRGSAHRWIRQANGQIFAALLGKLLPQTFVFFIMALLYNIWLYGILQFPLYSGPIPMLLASFLLVIASQGLGIFLISVIPWMRMAMSIASLWGVVSFSISGFTFPAIAMSPSLQALNNLFPLRHYFLIYTNEALNGYPILYSLGEYIALIIFALLPLPFLGKLKRAMITYEYIE